MARPIYLYTSDEIDGNVARIYAMGNPIVFWFGISSIVFLTYLAIKEKDKKLGFVVFSYLVFFTPWALSPRIMFLYHYLPSIPFMTIAIAYILRRYKELKWGFLTLALVTFIYFYPHFAGLKVPLQLDSSYYWFSSWR
jgi:dolichyl-phosphate-mannose--protein O-mannosyl transferase